jgi:hypothetical protein
MYYTMKKKLGFVLFCSALLSSVAIAQNITGSSSPAPLQSYTYTLSGSSIVRNTFSNISFSTHNNLATITNQTDVKDPNDATIIIGSSVSVKWPCMAMSIPNETVYATFLYTDGSTDNSGNLIWKTNGEVSISVTLPTLQPVYVTGRNTIQTYDNATLQKYTALTSNSTAPGNPYVITWTVTPASWTSSITSPQSLSTTSENDFVKPDGTNAGNVCCKITNTNAPGCSVSSCESVSLYLPPLQFSSGQTTNICPNSSSTYCLPPYTNVKNYYWNFPTGFVVTGSNGGFLGQNFDMTGPTTNCVVATAGPGSVSGNVQVTVQFNTGATIQQNIPMTMAAIPTSIGTPTYTFYSGTPTLYNYTFHPGSGGYGVYLSTDNINWYNAGTAPLVQLNQYASSEYMWAKSVTLCGAFGPIAQFYLPAPPCKACGKHSVPVENTSEDQIQEINIYPNPAKEMLNIEIPALDQNILISIFNTDGKLVKSMQAAGNTKTNLDLSSFSTGLYLVHFVSEDGTFSQVKKVQIVK